MTKGILFNTEMLRSRRPWTETALVVFGALFGSMVGLFVKAPLSIHYLAIFIPAAVVLLFLGVEGHVQLRRWWHVKTRHGLALSARLFVRISLCFLGDLVTAVVLQSYIAKQSDRWFLRPPRIGILDDLGWEYKNVGQICTYTRVSPEEWRGAITESLKERCSEVVVEFIKAEQNLDPFLMVLNPYGGAYPEYNLRENATFEKILNYVRAGGIFINVGDVPFYWACPLLERKQRYPIGRALLPRPIETADKPVHLEMKTPLLDRLGVPTYGPYSREGPYLWELEFENRYDIELGRPLKVRVDRIMQVEWETGTGTADIVTPVVAPKVTVNGRSVTPRGVKATPVFRANYGEGEFLISTPSLREPNDKLTVKGLRNVIADVIAIVAAEKLMRTWRRN